VTRLRYGLLENWSSILGKGGDFSLFRRVQTGSEARPAFYPMDIESSFFFLRIKGPGREADHSPFI
jgi:hypothetical protein